MKKYLSYLGASLVTIAALSSCNKELADPNEGKTGAVPFEISASSIDTRTENDGLSTKWVAGDAINLFHAAAGTTTYTSDGQFTITSENLAANKFTGTLAAALEAGNDDWYAFYPYSNYNTTPAGSSESNFGYTKIGGTSQTQTGNNSTAHLCGKTCPLYGVASAVANDVTPSIEMNHLTSIVEVNVTNNSGNELTVTSVSFTGTEDIVGTYYIDFTQTPVVYTSRGESYVSKTASLSVTDGEAIANGSSAMFYIAIKPFTVSSGKLKVAVNGYEKEITINNETVFAAGKIKKIKFNYNAANYVTLPWSIDGTGGGSVFSSTPGLFASGLGSDYASANSPYLTKFDGTGDYIQIKTDSQIGSVTIGVKMIGGANTSYIDVQGSADGTTFTSVQKLTISGKLNSTHTLTTTESFDEKYRYVKLLFTKGSNVGVGSIEVTKVDTTPTL